MSGERLHPEGAPGIQQVLQRAMLGDELYEATKDLALRKAKAEAALEELRVERRRYLNSLLAAVVLLVIGSASTLAVLGLTWLARTVFAGAS